MSESLQSSCFLRLFVRPHEEEKVCYVELQQMMSFFEVDGNAAIIAQPPMSVPKGMVKVSLGGKAGTDKELLDEDGDRHHFVRFLSRHYWRREVPPRGRIGAGLSAAIRVTVVAD